jgi:hypothetical protein
MAARIAEKLEPLNFDQVRQQEFAHIGLAEDDAPTALCLSGGGIRSATFALGVLQGFARKGLLGSFDYLSTVSGGGYIGGWLTAWCKQEGIGAVERKILEPDAAPVLHLRQYSNYLSPKLGLFSADTWTLGVTFVRNLFLNWLILLPMLIAFVIGPRLLVALLSGEPGAAGTRDTALAGVAAGLLLGVFSVSWPPVWLPRLRKKETALRSEGQFVIYHTLTLVSSALCLAVSWWHLGKPALEGLDWWHFVVGGAALNALGWAIGLLRVRVWPEALGVVCIVCLGAVGSFLVFWILQRPWFAELSANKLLYVTFCVPMVIGVALLSSFVFVGLGSWREILVTDSEREWWARSAAWLLIVASVWVGFCAIVLYAPIWLLQLAPGVQAWVTSGLGMLSGPLAALIGWNSSTAGKAENEARPKPKLGPALANQLAEKLLVPLFALSVVAAISLLITSLSAGSLVQRAEIHRDSLAGARWQYLLAAGLASYLFGWFIGKVFSVNRFSLNALYRNRLIRAYLGASRARRNPDRLTGFDEEDNVVMADLEPRVQKPLHLLNLALNVTRGEELAWQQRQARPFTVSCLHSGYVDDRCAYQPSSRYTYGGITLGTAVSVSGAAASPNMGYHSSKPLTFLMSVFNVRLGAWLPNPACTDADHLARDNPNSPLVLLWETLGLTGTGAKWVYLSDGGHFENLGLYEMMRRECGLMVVSDAGADPRYKFEDLSNAIQKARVDLGATTVFLAPPTLHNKRDKPGQHFALLYVRYRSGKQAFILYIKPAFSGIEAVVSRDVYNYATQHPTFPQQPTSDQFFDEAQFESYRRLGEQSVQVMTEGWTGNTLRSLFDHLIEKAHGAAAASAGLQIQKAATEPST